MNDSYYTDYYDDGDDEIEDMEETIDKVALTELIEEKRVINTGIDTGRSRYVVKFNQLVENRKDLFNEMQRMFSEFELELDNLNMNDFFGENVVIKTNLINLLNQIQNNIIRINTLILDELNATRIAAIADIARALEVPSIDNRISEQNKKFAKEEEYHKLYINSLNDDDGKRRKSRKKRKSRSRKSSDGKKKRKSVMKRKSRKSSDGKKKRKSVMKRKSRKSVMKRKSRKSVMKRKSRK
jgi:hypothetical protein